MNLFILQVIVSFVVGGLFIALQTLITERVPLFWRGFVITIPSTMALGLFFIGLTKSPNDIPEVALMIPAALGVTYLFAMIFAVFSRYNLILNLTGCLIVWFLASFLLREVPPSTFFTSTFLYGLPLIILSYLVVRQLPQVPHLKSFPMNATHILPRSLFAGCIIAVVVILAKTLGNVWGGIFSTFPAVYTSTFLIYTHLQGKIIMPSVIRSMFFPGALVMILYAWVAFLTFPLWGIWLSTLASYVAVFAFDSIYALIMRNPIDASRKWSV